MENEDDPTPAKALGRRVGLDPDAVQVAGAIAAIWREIDAALFPVVGRQGVAALYQRALFMTSRDHPWLASAYEGIQSEMNLTLLQSALLVQTGADASVGGSALLQVFNDILTGMVGASLTGRLLCSTWANSSGGTSARDT